MWEFDLVLLFQLIGVVLVIWTGITQVLIPWHTKRPFFPAFRRNDVIAELQRIREEELEAEIRAAQAEEHQAELEAKVYEAREKASQKRNNVNRRQNDKQ